MLKTILSVLPLILLFATGFLLQKLSFFKQSTIIDLKKIVANLALPALLFSAFVSLEFERKFLLVVVTMFVICLVMLFIGVGIRKLLKIESEYFPLLMAGFEMGMLGYALFLSIYGSENLSTFALVDLGQVLFVFFVLMGLLIQKKTGLRKKSELLKSFVSSPVIMAIIAGLAVSFLKQVIDPNIFFESINEFLNIIGSLTVPLIALVIGYELSIKKDGILLSLQTIIIRKVLLAVLAIVVNLLIIRNVLELPKIYEYAEYNGARRDGFEKEATSSTKELASLRAHDSKVSFSPPIDIGSVRK